MRRHRRAGLAPALPRPLNYTHARLSGKLAVAVAVGLALLAAALLLYLSRHLSFWWDEWTWILERRGNTLETYLRPHNNEHWSTVPIAIYQFLFRTVGIGSYAPYMATLTAFHAINGLLLFAVLRGRVGSEIALGATALLLFLGSAYQDLLWAFQVGYLASIPLGLGALLLLDVDRPDGRRQVAAGMLLLLSVASSGVGLIWCAAVFVEGMLRTDRWRVLPALALPLAGYVLWDIFFGPRQGRQALTDAITSGPAFVMAGLLHLAAGLSGLGSGAGATVLALAIGVVAWGACRRPLSARTWGALAALLLFYGSIAATRSQLGIEQANESRYIYVGAVFGLMIIAEAARSLRAHRSVVVRLVSAGIVVVSIVGNLSYFAMPTTTWWHLRLEGQSGQLSAAYLVRHLPGVDGTAPIDPGQLPTVDLRRWTEAVDQLGRPAGVLEETALDHAALEVRGAADQTLARLFTHELLAGPVGVLIGQARVRAAGGVTVNADGTACSIIGSASGLIDFDARAGDSLSLAALDGELAVRMYVAHFAPFQAAASIRVTVGNSATSLHLPNVPGWAWAVRIEAPPGSAIRVCGSSH